MTHVNGEPSQRAFDGLAGCCRIVLPEHRRHLHVTAPELEPGDDGVLVRFAQLLKAPFILVERIAPEHFFER
jgi:hypothetical protein